MKTLIIYESAHHSNTFKLVDEDMVKDMNGEYDFRYAREARHGKIELFTMILPFLQTKI